MKKLSPMEQEAKLKVLQDCMDDMDNMMGENLDKKKKMKVSVISDSPKGIKAGLEKAKDIVGGDHEMLDEVESEDDEELETDEESEEELDAKIAALMAKKNAKKKV